MGYAGGELHRLSNRRSGPKLGAVETPRLLALICVECGATSEDGIGWKTYVVSEGETATYCPVCAAKEFGPET